MLKRRRTLLALLTIAATIVLWLRPLLWVLERGEPDNRDFAPIIAGAHCLFHACDPYDSTMVEGFFRQLSGHGVFIAPGIPVYPPSSFLAVSPLLALQWPSMHLAWTLLGAFSLLAVYIFLILKFELYTSVIALVPLVCVLQSGIAFSALWVGQPALIVASTGVIGLILAVSGSAPILATLLLGFSLVLKPQLVLAPAIYLLFLGSISGESVPAGVGRRSAPRTPVAAALLLSGLVLLAGAALLSEQLGNLSFFGRESANMRLSFEPGNTSDPSPANPDSADFLNLQAPLVRLEPNLRLDNFVAYGISIALFAMLAYACLGKAAFRERPYTIMAALALLTLLPVYHREYDRLLLLLVIPALWELRRRSRALSWSVACLSFLWVFNRRLISDISPGAGYFPYTPLIEAALCVTLILGLFRYGRRGNSGATLEAATFKDKSKTGC